LFIYLFIHPFIGVMIKGRRPPTHHISSTTITTKNAQAIKMNKLTMLVTKPHTTSILDLSA